MKRNGLWVENSLTLGEGYIGIHCTSLVLVFLLFFLSFFREGKGERKRGRETSMCGCLLCAPGLQPRHVPWVGIEPVTLGSQAGTQPTEPHQPGLCFWICFKTSITESYFNKSLWIWELRGLLESEFLRQLKRKINCRWWVTEGEAVCFPRKGQRGMTREREGRGNEWRGRLSDANCGGSSRRTQHGGIWERPSPHGHFGLSPNTVYPEPWNQRYFPTK